MPDCSRSAVVHAILTAAEWDLIQEVRRIDGRTGYAVDLVAELRAHRPEPLPFGRLDGDGRRPPPA